MTNSDRLQEIRERAEKATKGPWIAPSWEVDDEPILMPLVMPAWKPHMKTEDGEEYECEGCNDCLDSEGRSADPYFVASAREDIPYLLQLVTEQQREIEELREELDGMAKTSGRWIAAAIEAGVSPSVTTEAKGYRKQERPM